MERCCAGRLPKPWRTNKPLMRRFDTSFPSDSSERLLFFATGCTKREHSHKGGFVTFPVISLEESKETMKAQSSLGGILMNRKICLPFFLFCALAPALGAAAQSKLDLSQRYLLLATAKTGTLQKELTEPPRVSRRQF